MKEKTEQILQYDDYKYFEYRKGGDVLTLYIAYWSPGKINPKDISWHTPDVCWVMNGWTRDWYETAARREYGGVKLKPVEDRKFSAGKQPMYVMFWHTVDGSIHSYGTAGFNPWYSTIVDMWRYGLNIRRKQFFVRLASNVPFHDLNSDPGFVELLNSLRPFSVVQ
jgi:hypothetical protein